MHESGFIKLLFVEDGNHRNYGITKKSRVDFRKVFISNSLEIIDFLRKWLEKIVLFEKKKPLQ